MEFNSKLDIWEQYGLVQGNSGRLFGLFFGLLGGQFGYLGAHFGHFGADLVQSAQETP